jgi:hypothetical protein
MPHLQFSVLCSPSARRFLSLRSLLVLRQLRFAAHPTLARAVGYPELYRATPWTARIPLQSMPREILQCPASSPHSSLNDAGKRFWERRFLRDAKGAGRTLLLVSVSMKTCTGRLASELQEHLISIGSVVA